MHVQLRKLGGRHQPTADNDRARARAHEHMLRGHSTRIDVDEGKNPATREMWNPATRQPPSISLQQERAVDYGGESASLFSFFKMFPTIIFRTRGSVIPLILVEIIISVGLGVVAWAMTDYGFCDPNKCDGAWYYLKETGREKGHGIIGVLLAFLVVFRSQIAWGMYWEGRNHIGSLVRSSRCLAIELLSSLGHASVEDGYHTNVPTSIQEPSAVSAEQSLKVRRSMLQRSHTDGVSHRSSKAEAAPGGDAAGDGSTEAALKSEMEKMDMELAILALESIRLLKLYYWTVVEVRADLPIASLHAALRMLPYTC